MDKNLKIMQLTGNENDLQEGLPASNLLDDGTLRDTVFLRNWGILQSETAVESEAEKLLPCMRKSIKDADRILHIISLDKACRERDEDGNITPREWEQVLQSFVNKLAGSIFEQYKIYQNILTDKEVNNEYANVEISDALGSFVDAMLVGDFLIVKTPLLANRNRSREPVKSNSFSHEYMPIFAHEVERKLFKIIDQLPSYLDKTITVVSVYSNQGYVPDADNLETKYITDAIVSFLKGGDSGKYTSFSMFCLHSEEIEEGAYFIVSEGFAKQPEIGIITTLLSNKYPAKTS